MLNAAESLAFCGFVRCDKLSRFGNVLVNEGLRLVHTTYEAYHWVPPARPAKKTHDV